MKAGKSPGLDGLAVEYYKKYIDILVPVLTMVYQETFKNGSLPDSFKCGFDIAHS